MRKIEFRARAKNKKCWVIGDLVHDGTGYSIIEKKGGCIRVKPETIGQYVGLCDENHKKIYEGDIVIDCEYGRYEVVYDNKYMRFAFRQGNINWGVEALFDGVCDCQVLGNKYDHPYLLDDGGEL